MKRKFAWCLAGALLLTFAGCGGRSLAETAKRDSSSVLLEVTVAQSGITLGHEFQAERKESAWTVSYSLERVNLVEKDENGEYVMPDSVTRRETGTLSAQVDGTVSIGEYAFPLTFFTAQCYVFRTSNFTEREETENAFSAKVIDPTAFFGRETEATDVVVAATFSDNAFVTLAIGFLSPSARITLQYRFA